MNTPEYYRTAVEWCYDRYQTQCVWLARSWLIILMLSVLLVLSLIANVMLIPLKEKIPYLYSFNNATGEVTKLGVLEPTTLSANWQLNRYFLMHYVMNRESYDINYIEAPYQLTWTQSDATIRQQYDNQVRSELPNSPYQLYGKDKFITVRVIAINRLNDNTAHIRFQKILHDRVANSEQVSNLEAIVKWQYHQEKITQKILDRNPLGFMVTYYQATPIHL